jgi:hypothetical protein
VTAIRAVCFLIFFLLCSHICIVENLNDNLHQLRKVSLNPQPIFEVFSGYQEHLDMQ